jgi:hypothetical protein
MLELAITNDEVLMDLTLQLRERYFYVRNGYPEAFEEDFELIKSIAKEHGIPEFIITTQNSIFEKLKHRLRELVNLNQK